MAALIGPILSWITYRRGNRRAYIISMALLLFAIGAFLFGTLLLEMSCGDKGVCMH